MVFMVQRIWIVISTVDSEPAARELASGAVQAGLAACAQVGSPISSHYTWTGRAEEAREWRITYKTGESRRDALMAWVRAQHPYEVPEIVGWEAPAVDRDYAAWITGA